MRPRPTSPLRSAARFLFLLLALALAGRAGAEVIVSNLSTSQRPDGSGLVDIRFDLATDDAATTQTFVTIFVSPDGGQSWPISSGSAYFAGDAGADVLIGTDKHVVWDAAADRPEVLWPNCRVRIKALDGPKEVTIMLPGDVPLVMVRIPAGSFVMGSPEDERGRHVSEGPQTNVTISRAFYMGKYEVKQNQWLAVMGAEWPHLVFPGRNRPMESVSWNDAQDFITTLNSHITSTGQGPLTMRLPTEAEWEYACRAGTTTRFYFGDSLIGMAGGDACEYDATRSRYMWYCGSNTPFGSKPVGGKLPNVFGLYDMHGNVSEWCQDRYTGSLPGGNVTDPTGGANVGSGRVWRGGHWIGHAGSCRSAYRDYSIPSFRGYDLGFRLASVR